MSNDANTAGEIIDELEADISRLQEKHGAVRLELSQAVLWLRGPIARQVV